MLAFGESGPQIELCAFVPSRFKPSPWCVGPLLEIRGEQAAEGLEVLDGFEGDVANGGSLSGAPIAQEQGGNAGKLARIVGDQGQVGAQRLAGDEQVVGSNFLTGHFQDMTDARRLVGCRQVKREHGDEGKQSLQFFPFPLRLAATKNAIGKLEGGD